MPAGKVVRQDNVTGEKMTARASSGDQDMFNAMIQDVLPSGAVPDVKAANEAGAKKLLQLVDHESRAVAKAKAKPRAAKPEGSEPVEPKTVLESGAQDLALRVCVLAKDKVVGVLDQASKARKISLELQNVEFASELSGQMKKHAEDMETNYVKLSKLTQANNSDDKSLKKMLQELAAKDQWFDKAEARQV
eukprot:s1614_g11.t1